MFCIETENHESRQRNINETIKPIKNPKKTKVLRGRNKNWGRNKRKPTKAKTKTQRKTVAKKKR